MIDDYSLLQAQQDVHELIAQQAPLETTLDAVAHWLGILLPRAVFAFMRFDPTRSALELYPSQLFSRHYSSLLNSVPVGSGVASFGTAAYSRRPVVTEDIETDPRWASFRSAALDEGLRACWSCPVLTPKGELLGTLCTYYRETTAPTDLSMRWLRQAVALIALAVIKDRESNRHHTLTEWHRSLFENHPDGVFEIDLDGRFQRCNAALERLTGYPERALVGRHFNEFVAPDYRELTQAAFDAARTGSSRQYETMAAHADGTLHYVEVANFPVTLNGKIVGVYGVSHDITQRKHQEAQLTYQANHDLLTGLLNRSALEGRLEHDYRWSKENQRLLVVMSLDLDGFKSINEGLGYWVGNQVLVSVADRLRQLLGPHDILARLTGDEFAFLMPDVTTREEVAGFAARILKALEHPFDIDGRALHLSASIGVACNEAIQQAHELLQHAALALNVSKQQGRNTWQWYQGNEERHTREQVLLRHDLHAALRDQQLELYYQPIVDAVSGRICSVEALVRWHHPVHGMVSPGIFIPIAEQTGQIIPLGRWVLRQACKSLAERYANGERVCPVAVNISTLQFRRDGFLDEVQAILDETGLPPELLELEVTESILLGGAERAIGMLETLRGLNITVAIDDFGTGFSSLSYLRDLPIHKIKLDRAFIRDILTNRSNAAIVQGIITMAHHMDLVVVAEGIEAREQQQDLIRRDCDLLQGFYFARPMPLEAVLSLPDILPGEASP